jgi:hypothetical protein
MGTATLGAALPDVTPAPVVFPAGSGSHVATPSTAEPLVTVITPVEEIWYKGQRVIRSVLVALVTLVPGLNLTLPLVAQAFNSPGVPAKVYLIVNIIIAGALVVTGILARLIAIPAINAGLTTLGVGSVPKSATRATVPLSQVGNVAKLS